MPGSFLGRWFRLRPRRPAGFARPHWHQPAVEQLENRVMPTAAHEALVTSLYSALLHRTPDPAEVAGWTRRLDSGISANQVVQDIEASTEYRTDLVENFYATYLKRPADRGGLQGFVAALAHGTTAEAVKATILGSNEYFHTRGHGTNQGFLSVLYEDVLGRQVDRAGLAAWLPVLVVWPRNVIAHMVIDSPEAEQRLVQGYYQQILGHAADSAGLSGFVASLQQGVQVNITKRMLLAAPGPFDPLHETTGQAQVIAAIAGSPEYAADAVAAQTRPITPPVLTDGGGIQNRDGG
jgi:hypothetical protein